MIDLNFLQNHLDEIKYYKSEKEGCDLSGKMDYCHECDWKFWNENIPNYDCLLSQSGRSSNCFCAKNYLKIKGES